MRQKDYYRILGIEKDATHQQVKETYRRLAFEFHPDRNKGDLNAVEKMKELNEAYAVLSDPEKRNRYDSMNQQYGYDGYDHFRKGYSEQDIFRGFLLGGTGINRTLFLLQKRPLFLACWLNLLVIW